MSEEGQGQQLIVFTPEEEAQLKVITPIVLKGDIGGLPDSQKALYIKAICKEWGLNPLTRPFDILAGAGGKAVLYANRTCTDQLRKIHKVSIHIVERVHDEKNGVFYVRAQATMPDGREDEAIGAKAVVKMAGTDLANAIMAAETKAKRRVTLSIVGLGISDESEVDDIPRDAKSTSPRRFVPTANPESGRVQTRTVDAEIVDTTTGEILEADTGVVPRVPEAVSVGPKTVGPPSALPKPLPPTVAPINIPKK